MTTQTPPGRETARREYVAALRAAAAADTVGVDARVRLGELAAAAGVASHDVGRHLRWLAEHLADEQLGDTERVRGLRTRAEQCRADAARLQAEAETVEGQVSDAMQARRRCTDRQQYGDSPWLYR